jgi:hypothetical protein
MVEVPAASVATQRIVPGAPPPAPVSKSQRKKRKTQKKGDDENGIESPVIANAPGSIGTANSEHNYAEEKPAEAPTAPETAGTQTPALVDEEAKPSPIVDFIGKRLKQTTKKIVCIF